MSRRVAAGGVALAALLTAATAGCSSGQSVPGPPAVTVGAAPTSESKLLAHLYSAALGYFGIPTRVHLVPDPVAALDSADVTVAPGLTGELLARFVPHATARADEQVKGAAADPGFALEQLLRTVDQARQAGRAR